MLLPFSNSRYLSGYQWIAIGILATYGIEYIASRFFCKKKLLAFVLMAFTLFLLSIPSWMLSLGKAVENMDKRLDSPQVFQNKQIVDTLEYLNNIKDPTCVIAAPDWFSTMIPAYTSCRGVSGHRLMTYANDIKVYEMNEFFFHPKPLSEKAGRIQQYGITHVVTLNGITGMDILPLLAPTPAFTSGGVKVYEVR